MIDTLATVLAIVDHDAETVVQLQLLGDLSRYHQQVAEQLLVAVVALRQRLQRLLWDDESVCGRCSDSNISDTITGTLRMSDYSLSTCCDCSDACVTRMQRRSPVAQVASLRCVA